MTDAKNNPQESDLPEKLGAPAYRALHGAGYWRLEQLAEVTADEINALHGIGPTVIKKLRSALEAKGLSFAGE